jgi:transcriptional regulator with XRE-family HTH domain
MENITFSEIVERVLESYGISEAELARRVGTTQATVNRWRRGQIKEPGYMAGTKLVKMFDKAPA